MVCRTQGDKPLLSKVSLARIQVTVLLPHPSLLSLSFWGTPGQGGQNLGGGDFGCLWKASWSDAVLSSSPH